MSADSPDRAAARAWRADYLRRFRVADDTPVGERAAGLEYARAWRARREAR